MIDPPPALLGIYRPPAARVGGRLTCAVRGRVTVGGYSKGPIPWPVVARPGKPTLIVCGDLVRALRREAAVAVAHWWGVTTTTVLTWRKAVGVTGDTAGAARLKAENGRRHYEAVKAKLHAPAAVAKSAAARRGRPLSAEHRAKLRAANLGKRLTAETRRKVSATRKRLGLKAPDRTDWAPWEDELLRSLPPEEVASRTGRPMFAVYGRRFRLGLTKKHWR
jgi:hypothetical protein